MRKTSVFTLISILFLAAVSSCTNYLIPVESFKHQFAGIDSSKLLKVNVSGPYGESYSYLANPVKTIHCVDKDGKAATLKNSPSIEIRFTYGEKNKHTVFYFDRVFVNDSLVFGVESRFISSIRNKIPLNTITKIEVQDGHKKFTYN
jgi:hypothetical protein